MNEPKPQVQPHTIEVLDLAKKFAEAGDFAWAIRLAAVATYFDKPSGEHKAFVTLAKLPGFFNYLCSETPEGLAAQDAELDFLRTLEAKLK